jgi:hypothetical protein
VKRYETTFSFVLGFEKMKVRQLNSDVRIHEPKKEGDIFKFL